MMMAMLVESDCITLLPRAQTREGPKASAMVALELETPAPSRMVGYAMRSDWLRTAVRRRSSSICATSARRRRRVNVRFMHCHEIAATDREIDRAHAFAAARSR